MPAIACLNCPELIKKIEASEDSRRRLAELNAIFREALLAYVRVDRLQTLDSRWEHLPAARARARKLTLEALG